MRQLIGTVASAGLAVGPAARVDRAVVQLTAAVSTEAPAERLAAAQRHVQEQLDALAAELRAEQKPDEAAIFDAQALLAVDPALADEALGLAHGGVPLPDAVEQAVHAMAETLSALDDDYLQARAADVRAVGQQIAATLRGVSSALEVVPGAIVLAADLTPAQTVGLRKAGIAGFATAGGTVTGHVAILARALGLPAVVGLGDSLLDVPDGVQVLLDAGRGRLLVEPGPAELEEYARSSAAAAAVAERRLGLVGLPAATTDGRRIALWANIGHPDEAQRALELGAEGIGLFRTEFLFLERDAPPSEDEQVAAYRQVLQLMDGRPVVIRTLDIGGDKPIPYLPQPAEPNPFLGWRGVRFAVRFPELFQTQLRALLRAATAGDLRIMLPMVATAEDVAWACGEIETAAAALAAAGTPFRSDVPFGIMVETPAAALTLDLLGTNVRFCSIGSNDLAQYTLAADRGDAALNRRYRHDDPAVMRMIRLVAEAAAKLGLELSLCGELASEPQSAVALVGLGVEKLSMVPASLLAVKEAIRGVALPAARLEAARVCHTPVG